LQSTLDMLKTVGDGWRSANVSARSQWNARLHHRCWRPLQDWNNEPRQEARGPAGQSVVPSRAANLGQTSPCRDGVLPPLSLLSQLKRIKGKRGGGGRPGGGSPLRSARPYIGERLGTAGPEAFCRVAAMRCGVVWTGQSLGRLGPAGTARTSRNGRRRPDGGPWGVNGTGGPHVGLFATAAWRQAAIHYSKTENDR
jgi:hypothetical protein